MTSSLTILLQDAPAGGGYQQLILLGGIMLVFYFFMIRPQMKKNKEAKNFRASLEKGSHVVTIGGIHGKVLDIQDRTVLIATEQGKLKVEKTALSANSSANEMDMQQRK